MTRTLKTAADVAPTEGQETAPESVAAVTPEEVVPVLESPAEGHASDEDPVDALPPVVAAAPAPEKVQTLKRGQVIALAHIKRSSGAVAPGEAFAITAEERESLRGSYEE